MSRSALVTCVCNTIIAMMVAGAQVRADEDQFSAVEHARRSIYHSPQTPGFTSWALRSSSAVCISCNANISSGVRRHLNSVLRAIVPNPEQGASTSIRSA